MGARPPYFKNISNIYIIKNQRLGIIGVFGPLNNLSQAPLFGHAQKTY
jgi:hypothetical protein